MKRGLVLGLVMVFLLLLSCAPGAKPAPAPAVSPAPMKTAVPLVAAPSPSPWEKIVQAGREEGKVYVYDSTIGPAARAPLRQAFQQRYGISLELVFGRAAELNEKIAGEQRAHAYTADVFAGGFPTHLPLKERGMLAEPINVPEAMDISLWRADPRGGEPEGYMFQYGNHAAAPTVINTKLVSPAEEPKSWFDLLDPKWKGRMVMDDPSISGPGGSGFTLIKNYVGGVDYWRKMGAQNVKLMRDKRAALDMVVHGEYPILIWSATSILIGVVEAGAPIKIVDMKEGYFGGGWALALIKNSPHPNAAKVFVNWFISQEGQTLWSRALRIPSTRLDVSQEHVHPQIRPLSQRVIVLTAKDYAEMDKDMALAAEIFGLRK